VTNPPREARMMNRGQRVGWVCVAVSVFLVGSPCWAHAGPEKDLVGLNERLVELYQQGRYPEATEVANRALEKSNHLFGNNHPEVATALNNLAALYYEGQYAQAALYVVRTIWTQGVRN